MPDARAVVRPARPDDASAIAALYAPYVTGSVVSLEEVPPTAEVMAGRMATGLPWYVAESDRGVLGYAYASAHRDRAGYRWSVDVSVYLAPAARRLGLGRALYARLLGVLTELGYVRAHAGITLPNAASVGLHEAVGFVHVARYPEVGWKNGGWLDVGWWSRPLAPASTTPGEPRRWDRLT